MAFTPTGIGAVNPTPQHADGRVNEEEYRRYIRWLVDKGVRFLQPSAATGQSLQTSREEYRRLLRISVEEVGDRAAVTAYAGRADPRETIAMVNEAAAAGAHAAYLIQPFFSTPDQEGLYLHYKMVAQATTLPLVFYNNAARAGVNLSIDVMDRLTDEFPNFVALKQSDVEQFPNSVRRLRHKIVVTPKSEHHMLFGFALGSPGVLTFAANIIPDRLAAIHRAWFDGDQARARDLYLECLPLFDIIHIEPVPNAIHHMLNRMGWAFGTPRVPAHPLSPEHARAVDAVLEKFGLVQSAAAE
ncbi:MAG: dihydrodipicolinate synthase family protein [Alphaproteobacteria bacterium]|nr:dihydrodipicolinate synthase family protein [Alphaproteobacteria bacterium]